MFLPEHILHCPQRGFCTAFFFTKKTPLFIKKTLFCTKKNSRLVAFQRLACKAFKPGLRPRSARGAIIQTGIHLEASSVAWRGVARKCRPHQWVFCVSCLVLLGMPSVCLVAVGQQLGSTTGFNPIDFNSIELNSIRGASPGTPGTSSPPSTGIGRRT